jgi:hypothetical protein
VAPTYTYVTQAQAIQQVANRLYDPNQVFWTHAELQLYLLEALQTWNALAAYWRGDFVFPSQQGVPWYDLTAVPNTLRPYTVLDTDIYTLIQYHLLEPAVGVDPWTGVSAQFTANDLVAAVQRRMDELLSVTGCTITRTLVGAAAGRTLLPQTIIDVRRIAYLPAALGVPTVLWPEDAWAEQSFDRNYTITPAGAPGTPSTYLMSTQPPLSFDTDAPPYGAGNYEVLSVSAGPTLSVAAPSLLPIPSDWAHVIKWGALADLFSRDSNARDIPRAQYCEQRYRMGLSLLVAAPALLTARIGNVPLQIDAVRSLDLYRTGWQAEGQGFPNTMASAGLNLYAIAPTPNAGTGSPVTPYALTATVVQNAPLPSLDADPVQVAREDFDAVIDYTQHLASLKMGGAEFLATTALLQRFLKQAQLYNTKLAETAEFTTMLYGISQQEESRNPRTVPAAASAGGS